MPRLDIKSFLKPHLPASSLDYCAELWHRHPFHLKITRKRKTKLGDYRYHNTHKTHTITVNGDLNIYHFLITYLHEVAHLQVQMRYKTRVLPHGKEWKQAFGQLLAPMVNESVFPKDILTTLQKHMANPRATSYADPALSIALRSYDVDQRHTVHLSDLDVGHHFEINGRKFKKLKNNRTRVICRDLKNGKNYLVSKMAEVRLLSKGDSSSDQSTN